MKFFGKIPFEAKSLRDLREDLIKNGEHRLWIIRTLKAMPSSLRKNDNREKKILESITKTETNTNPTSKVDHRFLVRSRQWIFWGLIDWEVEDYIVAPNRAKALERARW